MSGARAVSIQCAPSTGTAPRPRYSMKVFSFDVFGVAM
jgi:hypothetical protein